MGTRARQVHAPGTLHLWWAKLGKVFAEAWGQALAPDGRTGSSTPLQDAHPNPHPTASGCCHDVKSQLHRGMTKFVLLTFVELIRPPITAYELRFVASHAISAHQSLLAC